MARKKVQLRYITEAAARKASLKKRRHGLLKKVQELSILCDVQACAVVYGEDKIEQPVHWPEDRGQVDMVLQRFQACPEMERLKKMVTKDDYVRQRTEKYKEQAKRLQSSIHEMEMLHLMQLIHVNGRPHGEFTTSELQKLNGFLSEKVKELERKADVLIKVDNAAPPSPPPSPAGGVPPPNPLAAPSTPAGNFQGLVEMLRRRTPISGSSVLEQIVLPYPHQSEGTISRFPAGNLETGDVSGMTNDQGGDCDAFFGHNLTSTALGVAFPYTIVSVGGYAPNPYEWSNNGGPGLNMEPVGAIGEEYVHVGPYMETQPCPGLNTEHGGIGDVVRGYFDVSKYLRPTHGYPDGIPSLQNPMLGRNIHGRSRYNVQAPPENIPGVVAVSNAPASLTSFINNNNPRSGGF